jgi:hypothetical protein
VLRDLLFRRRQCMFIAFDLLYLNGKDLRMLPIIIAVTRQVDRSDTNRQWALGVC